MVEGPSYSVTGFSVPKRIGGLFAEDETFIPEDYVLKQNCPNPFNPTTEITFALPKASSVTLSIYNTSGQLIRTLINGYRSEGFHSVIWNATDKSGSRVSSGMYVYVLRAGEVILQNRMVLIEYFYTTLSSPTHFGSAWDFIKKLQIESSSCINFILLLSSIIRTTHVANNKVYVDLLVIFNYI